MRNRIKRGIKADEIALLLEKIRNIKVSYDCITDI